MPGSRRSEESSSSHRTGRNRIKSQGWTSAATVSTSMEGGAPVRMAPELPTPRHPLGIPRGQLPRFRAARMHRHPAAAFMRWLLMPPGFGQPGAFVGLIVGNGTVGGSLIMNASHGSRDHIYGGQFEVSGGLGGHRKLGKVQAGIAGILGLSLINYCTTPTM